MPISSLCSNIDEIQGENNQIKGAIVETIIEVDEGRPFPVQCEIFSNAKFKYKVSKVFFLLNIVKIT